MVERRSEHGKSSGYESGGSLRSAASDPGLAASSNGFSQSINGYDAFGSSSSSFDLSMSATRSLGSRGSLCDEAADDCDSVNVVVRCRPLNERERKGRDEGVVSFPGDGQIWVNLDGVNGKSENKPKVFAYNVVFEPEALQDDILDHSGSKRLIDMAIDGFSCTIFCYGQTGSGKTHTLTGPPDLFQRNHDLLSDNHGLIVRAFVYLFEQLQGMVDREFTITASFLEIYNEKVLDLLNMGNVRKGLQVRWNKKIRGFFVENLFKIECYELDDLLAVLEEGLRNRAVASHSMNEYSSRSHTILSVNITSEQKAEEGVTITKNGKLNFVDLAGSEMTKKTNSEGKTLEEANNINKSLLVLGTCISALSDRRKKDGHIPYRDSNLTKLLADSLAGSGVTLMIACVSPAKYNLHETLNTLRYASRAKRIRTKPIVIMDPKEKAILSLQREVNTLQEENYNLKMLLNLSNASTPPGIPSSIKDQHMQEMEEKNSHESASTARAASLALAGTVGNFNSEVLRQGLPSRRASLRNVDETKLQSLDNSELIGLVKRYMSEHDNVKKENKELQMITAALIRDQELMAKENERLTRKLEAWQGGDRKRSITRPNTELLASSLPERILSKEKNKSPNNNKRRSSSERARDGAQVWVNPVNGNDQAKTSRIRNEGSPNRRIPHSINKELERRQIGRSLTDLSGSPSGNESRTNSGEREREMEHRSRPQNQNSTARKNQKSKKKRNSRESPTKERSHSVPKAAPVSTARVGLRKEKEKRFAKNNNY